MTDMSLGHSLRAGFGAALLCAALGGQGAYARAWAGGEDVPLVPHRAIYELTLAATRGGTGVQSVAGRMVYDLTGSPCEGYTQAMRFVTRLMNQSGSATVSDLRSTTWEDSVGKHFRFDSSQFRDDKSTEVTAGDAARLGVTEGIKVDLTKPAKRSLSLPAGAYFPIQHTIALIQAAREGKSSFRANLYDGSEKGEKVYDTVAALGRSQAPGANRKLAEAAGTAPLNTVQAWPVSIAYFEPRSEGMDALPVYEIAFLMFENGVSRKLHIDYGDFALEGDLTEIAFHEPSKCDPK
ncbi:MAG: cell envelope integrity EipB family protein [Hyphomicrobiaceae bacterium]|nr:cell envelope integrity EipB family protein [Hyphomicrobiaceae bacterium]